MEFKFIMFLILSVLVAIFTIQNSAPVTISFFMFNQEISQALIILIAIIIGAIMALFLGLIRQFSTNKSIKGKDKVIKDLEKERDELRLSVDEYKDLLSKKEVLEKNDIVLDNNQDIIIQKEDQKDEMDQG